MFDLICNLTEQQKRNEIERNEFSIIRAEKSLKNLENINLEIEKILKTYFFDNITEFLEKKEHYKNIVEMYKNRNIELLKS